MGRGEGGVQVRIGCMDACAVLGNNTGCQRRASAALPQTQSNDCRYDAPHSGRGSARQAATGPATALLLACPARNRNPPFTLRQSHCLGRSSSARLVWGSGLSLQEAGSGGGGSGGLGGWSRRGGWEPGVTCCRAAPLHRQHHAARVGKAQAASHEGLVICSRSNDRGEPGGLDRPVRVSGSRAHACLRPLQAGGARQAAPREPAAHQQQKSPHGGHSWVPHCSFLSNGCRIARGGRKSVR